MKVGDTEKWINCVGMFFSRYDKLHGPEVKQEYVSTELGYL